MNWEKNGREWCELIAGLIERIRASFKPDILVPIMNGGLVPGGIIAAQLKIKDLRPVSIGRTSETRYFLWPADGNIGDITGKKILLIEDDVPSGKSVNLVREKFLAAGAAEVRIVCVYKRTDIIGIDYYAVEVDDFPEYWWKVTNLGDR
jgi:uncharacterized protein